MLNKKNAIIAIGLIALYFILRKPKPKKKMSSDKGGIVGGATSAPDLFTEEDAKNGLEMLAETRGKEIAKIAERVLRWETAHFKSKQYKKTGSAGMEVGNWANLPDGMESIPMTENRTGKTKRFIVWGSPYAFLNYFADYVERWDGNWARWFSTNPKLQAEYRAKVNTVKNRIVV
jgi:hypothetical protein